MLHIPGLSNRSRKHSSANTEPIGSTRTPHLHEDTSLGYLDPDNVPDPYQGRHNVAETHHLRYLSIKKKHGIFSRPTHHMYEFDTHFHSLAHGPGAPILPGGGPRVEDRPLRAMTSNAYGTSITGTDRELDSQPIRTSNEERIVQPSNIVETEKISTTQIVTEDEHTRIPHNQDMQTIPEQTETDRLKGIRQMDGNSDQRSVSTNDYFAQAFDEELTDTSVPHSRVMPAEAWVTTHYPGPTSTITE